MRNGWDCYGGDQDQCLEEHAHFPDATAMLLALNELGPYEALKLWGCPCFTVHLGVGTTIYGYCWRTGPSDVRGCSFEAFRLDEATTAALKAHLDAMNWYGPWEPIRE